MGRPADGIFDHGLRILLVEFLLNGQKYLFILRGLRHQKYVFPVIRELINLFRAVDHNSSSLGVAHQTDHLGMVGIANDNRVVTPSRMPFDRRLNTGNPLAGGIQQSGADPSQLVSLLRGDAVCADDNLLARTLPDVGLGHDTFFLEHRQHLTIVYQRAKSADAFPFLQALDCLKRYIQSVSHPSAKSGCPGYDHFHQFMPFPAQDRMAEKRSAHPASRKTQPA